MRWDDIQILKALHHLENSESGYLLNGFVLMEKIRPSVPADIGLDANLFAKELVLARTAGYIEFNDQARGGHLADPWINGHYWLQQIRDIRLTLSGRDRALGRILLYPPPDPAEDDGRNISTLTLREVATAIGASYSLPQLRQFLSDSGLPPFPTIDEGSASSAEVLLSLLEDLHAGGSAGRRALRVFIGSWLSNRLHSWPSLETRKSVLTHLGQQGWHLHGDRIVVGEQVAAPLDPRHLSGPIVATVVRTDVAASTQMRRTLGETAWADRRDEHYSSLRRLLEDYQGNEINDLGDGLLTWFASPVEAVRFAIAAMNEAETMTLAIRIAIDCGECKVLEPSNLLDGLVLARVERLVARASPHEVLISNSVRPLLGDAAPVLSSKDVELADFGPMTAYLVSALQH